MPQWLKTHPWQWGLGLALIVVAAVVAAVLARQNSVEYVAPRHGPIVEAIYGLGKVKTARFYEVKVGVPLTIQKLHVHEGDRVRQGAALVQFKDGPLFSAPFDGTVTLVAFQEAQSVYGQQTALRLEDLSTKYIEVSLEQQGALRVQIGQPVKIVFEGIRGDVLQGKVSALFSRSDEFLAHIQVPLSDNILPGMTADVSIEAGRREQALLVPVAAVSDGRVRIVRDGRRLTVKLKLGSIDGNWAEVQEGDLLDTDRVILKPEKKKEG